MHKKILFLCKRMKEVSLRPTNKKQHQEGKREFPSLVLKKEKKKKMTEKCLRETTPIPMAKKKINSKQ